MKNIRYLFILSLMFSVFVGGSFPGVAEKAQARPKFRKQKKKSVKKKKIKKKLILETTAVRKIQRRMAKRMPLYQSYRTKKYIGESMDGLVKVRSLKKLSAKKKNELKKLVAIENRDRETLYGLIVKDNKYDKKMEAVLRESFFNSYQEWAPKGTYFYKDKKWQKK